MREEGKGREGGGEEVGRWKKRQSVRERRRRYEKKEEGKEEEEAEPARKMKKVSVRERCRT